MRKSSCRSNSSQAGSVLMELALVMPLFLSVVFGTIEITTTLFEQAKLAEVARYLAVEAPHQTSLRSCEGELAVSKIEELEDDWKDRAALVFEGVGLDPVNYKISLKAEKISRLDRVLILIPGISPIMVTHPETSSVGSKCIGFDILAKVEIEPLNSSRISALIPILKSKGEANSLVLVFNTNTTGAGETELY